MKGIKHDADKNQLELLSAVWIEGVGRVLSFGARKYSAHNWRNGLARSRLLGACLRHVFAYLRGEDFDPETGLLHLYHASCCLMFASELHFTKPETDDRYREEKSVLDGILTTITEPGCTLCGHSKEEHLDYCTNFGDVPDTARGHCYTDPRTNGVANDR